MLLLAQKYLTYILQTIQVTLYCFHGLLFWYNFKLRETIQGSVKKLTYLSHLLLLFIICLHFYPVCFIIFSHSSNLFGGKKKMVDRLDRYLFLLNQCKLQTACPINTSFSLHFPIKFNIQSCPRMTCGVLFSVNAEIFECVNDLGL